MWNFLRCQHQIPKQFWIWWIMPLRKDATTLELIFHLTIAQHVDILVESEKLAQDVEGMISRGFVEYLDYSCPLKLRPSRARVCMHMQASKNKKLGWLLFEESALFGNFAATKQTSLPKHGQRYTFSRTADTKSATKLLQQAKNPSDEPRNGR